MAFTKVVPRFRKGREDIGGESTTVRLRPPARMHKVSCAVRERIESCALPVLKRSMTEVVLLLGTGSTH